MKWHQLILVNDSFISPSINILYLGDMRRIHQKSQNIENRKIQFFQQILGDYISIIDNDRMKPVYSTISQAERSAIDNINSAADLDVWNKKIGLSDDCEIPVSYTHLTLPTNREV